jgi:hypothetical protein
MNCMRQPGFILLAVILYISAVAQQKITSPKQGFKHLLSPAHQAFLKGNSDASLHSSAYNIPSVSIADRPGLLLFNNSNVSVKVTIQYYHTQKRYEDYDNFISPLIQSVIQDKQLRQIQRR